jgi:hypothetical protein
MPLKPWSLSARRNQSELNSVNKWYQAEQQLEKTGEVSDTLMIELIAERKSYECGYPALVRDINLKLASLQKISAVRSDVLSGEFN